MKAVTVTFALATLPALGCGKSQPPAPTPVAADAAAPAPTTPPPATTPAEADAATTAPVEADAAPTAPVEADAAPTAPADAAPTEADAAAVPTGPLAEVCAGIAATSKQVLDDLAKKVAQAENKDDLVPEPVMSAGCLAAPPYDKGTWAIGVVSFDIDKDEYAGAPLVSLATALTWIGPDGQQTKADHLIGFSLGTGQVKLTAARVEDFARDGVPELILDVAHDSPDHHTTAIDVYRVADGKVADWVIEPAIAKIEDADGDGVPDFLHEGVFEATQGRDTLGSPFLAVTRVGPGGTLEKDGEAVKAYYKKQCPQKTTAADIATAEDYLKAAACAWLYGEKLTAIGEAVTARVEKAEAGLGDLTSGYWDKPDAKPPVALE